MANSPEENKKKKKKCGCLCYLWRLFILLILVLAIATGFFYWKKTATTAFLLEKYSIRLAKTLTSPIIYQINEDQAFIKRKKGEEKLPGFSIEKIKKEILEQRRTEAVSAFKTLVDAYKSSPDKEWYKDLKALDLKLKEIFLDKKVSPVEEFHKFLEQVKKVAKKNKGESSKKTEDIKGTESSKDK